MRILHILFRVSLVLLAIIIAIPCVAAGWMYFSTSGLPDVRQLRAFVPTNPTPVAIGENGRNVYSNALPSSLIGTNLRNACLAAHGDLDTRGWIRRYYANLAGDLTDRRYGGYSFQLARNLPHDTRMGLKWQLWWMRTAIQIERRFNPDEMLTIFMNTAHFGDDLYGVDNAALHYFQKHPANLTPAEAALIATLIQRPTYLSPEKHPDRALESRNRVIDRMLAKGLLIANEAQRAKQAPLLPTAMVARP